MNRQQKFIIRPNCSLSWRQLFSVYVVVVLLMLSTGSLLFWHGMPLVLPFYGCELLLLGLVFYQSSRRANIQEVITVDADRVVVESGVNVPVNRFSFQRQWARIVLLEDNSWYPRRLLIRSHGRQLEIGRFLNEQERAGLAVRLKGVLG